ncbi:MAG: RagB/SusD family nutrient uptake outer membrane protein [Bacteroidales bacterium]|nr:RagB/SusD family nutrient uptake outer membrane protein [Bacteroidales bacterium]MBN2763214.1 RagB/SusD family nutrient uptake outer membrane protein [Bacteroidales bacterium]
MKKKTYYIGLTALLLSIVLLYSCTDLEEIPQDKVTSETLIEDPDLIPNLIAPALGQLKGLWYRESYWGLQEACSDELCFPTRGTDWFDGGVWQEQWLHTWTPVHRDVAATWNRLNSAIAAANFGISVLGTDEDVTDEIKGYRSMLRFLRDFYMYCLIDLYGVSPYRDPYSTDYTTSPVYLTREQAFYFIVSDLKTILDDMPEKASTDYGVPNRDACCMLLAKMYINKEVFVGQAAWDSSLIYLNQIIDPGSYQLADNYFGMFGPDNHLNFLQPGDEAIFVTELDDDQSYGIDDQVIWIKHTFHYNQFLMGDYQNNWNGCVAPEGYLNECWFNDTDTATDVRWVDSTIYPVMAVVNGFNYGQQYNTAGEALGDRGGLPLYFTFDCPLDDANESQGVRVLKYAPRDQPVNIMRTPNDFIIYRYADALLMKAECLARNGNMGEALIIVNEIRTKRKAPALASMELIDILRERGRELYWEGHRRQDMIRFGTFLNPKPLMNKPDPSPETAKLVPIPQTAIEAAEGALKQNPGY